MKTLTQSDRVLAFLRAHDGATAMELTMGIEPYVSNVRARISDLRAEGHVIEARKRTDGRVGLFLGCGVSKSAPRVPSTTLIREDPKRTGQHIYHLFPDCRILVGREYVRIDVPLDAKVPTCNGCRSGSSVPGLAS